jgi:outer membrane immunogenic protein
MNIKIIAALSVGLFATQVSALEISAIDKKNSSFVGAYGQIATGYESNTAQSSTFSLSAESVGTYNAITGQNPTSDGVALVLGGGYNFQIDPKFLLGVGGDWSAFNNVTSDATYYFQPGITTEIGYKTSNRYSIFFTPSYVIDKDKLAYFKVGYTGQGVTLEGDGGSTLGGSAQLSGYALGLGYKQMITHGVYAFGEGNYYGYSKTNWNTNSDNNGGTPANFNANPDVISYTFLAGVGYVY